MDLKDKIRAITPEMLHAHGFLQSAKASGYVCPFCGNGTGETGTGVDFTEYKGTYSTYCFKCGKSFDVIDVLAKIYNLDTSTDFKEILNRANSDFFGENANFTSKTFTDSGNAAKSDNAESKTSTDKKVVNNFTVFYKRAQKNLDAFLLNYGRGGFYRGISKDIFQAAGCGFFPALTPKTYWDAGIKKGLPVFVAGLPYLIIPTCASHHQIRVTVNKSESETILDRKIADKTFNDGSKTHAGVKHILYFDELKTAKAEDVFFLVEGPFDAFSIKQVGFKVVSTMGSDVTKAQLAELEKLEVKPRIIVIYDNDITGAKKAKNAVKNLQKVGFLANFAFLPDKIQKADGEIVRIKDANELLQADETALKNCLSDILKSTKENFDFEAENKKAEDSKGEQKSKKAKTSKQMFPDCPADVFIPYGFFVSDKTGTIYKRFETHEIEQVSPTPIFVTKLMPNQKGTDYKVEICYRERGAWKTFSIDMRELFDSRTYGRIFCDRGIMLTSKDASRLSEYLARMIGDCRNTDRIAFKPYYTQTGWLDGKFIYPGEGVDVKSGNFDYDEAFKVEGDRDKLLELLLQGIYQSTAARLSFGGIFTAPCVDFLGDKGTRNLQYHLWGATGSGKTTVMIVGMAAFGSPVLLQGTFSDTPKYIHEHSARFNFLPVWVDELQTLDEKYKPRIDSLFIYPFEKGETKGRLTKDVTERPKIRFRGTRITTGEEPLIQYTSNQGALERVLEIDATDIVSYQYASEVYETFTNAPTYGHFGREYCNFLSQAGVRKEVKAYFKKIQLEIKYQALLAKGFEGTREEAEKIPDKATGLSINQIIYYAAAFTGLYAFCRAIYKDESMLAELEKLIIKDIKSLVAKAEIKKQTSNAERLLPAILESTVSQASRFSNQRTDRKFNPASSNLPMLGYKFIDNRVGFLRQELRNLIKNLGGFNPTEIIKGLHDLGILEEGNDVQNKFTKAVTITSDYNSEQVRVYLFKADAENLLEDMKRRQSAKLMQI